MRRAVGSVMVTGLIIEEFAEQFFGVGGGILRSICCRFYLVSFLFGSFGEATRLPRGAARLIGTFPSSGDGIVVTPFPGQVGRFLGQFGSLFRPVRGLLGPFSPLAGLLG
jgi:hypothetical protein